MVGWTNGSVTRKREVDNGCSGSTENGALVAKKRRMLGTNTKNERRPKLD